MKNDKFGLVEITLTLGTVSGLVFADEERF